MFDIGWTEMAVIALVALMVIGPKDLPRVMRMAGQWARKARSLSREFQSGLDEMMRETELDEARKTIESAGRTNIDKLVGDTVDPTGSVSKEMRDIDRTARDTTRESSVAGGGDSAKGAAKAAPAAADASGSPAGDAQGEKAQVIKHPVQVAPAHSLGSPGEAEVPVDKTVAEPVDTTVDTAAGQKSGG
jgi:sec-independent protein translocase protein TatB